MATKKKIKTVDGHGDVHEYTVTKGSHLTVYTYKDGSTRLEWNDEALLHDVRNALASVESKPLNSVEESVKAIEKAKKSSKKAVKKEKK